MSEAHDASLQAILQGYLQAIDRGEKPDRQALLDANPDLRDELAEYFADASKLEQVARSMRTLSFGAGEPSGVSRRMDPGAHAPGLATVRYFGDYELLEEIARGGMGVVYKAKQVSLNRVVALKMILKGEFASEADVRSFRQEAEAAANLDHPNIVPIYEVGEHEGQQYFSMKLIETAAPFSGEPKASAGDNPAAYAARLAKVARAVHHAHQRGILHRDLKPRNILIDRNSEPHVADFGLAKKVDGSEDATKSGAIVGTPAYMAPEQARAEKSLTTAVDVYSLGAILYEWLTGRPPFRGGDVLSTLMQVVHDEPAKPRTLVPTIDRDLETICLKCLEKEPTRRYRSAESLADDLERWLRGEPIAARQASRREQLWKWARRRPAQATLLVVCILGGGLFLAQLLISNANLRHAQGETAAALESMRAEKTRAEQALVREQRLFYANRITQAHREWQANYLDSANKLLQDCPEPLRGWEWSLLHRLCQPKLISIQRNESGNLDLASSVLSPDGTLLAATDMHEDRESGYRIHVVKLWDTRTGQLVRLLPGQSKLAGRLAFSADGRRLALATGLNGIPAPGMPGVVRVWNVADGQEIYSKSDPRGFWGVALSPDGERLAVCDNKTPPSILIVKTANGAKLLDFKGFGPLAWHAEGKLLAGNGRDNLLHLWDVDSGKIVSTCRGNSFPSFHFAFSPDGKRLVSAGGEFSPSGGEARVWDTGDGHEVANFHGHGNRLVLAAAFSPDGLLVASGGLDQHVRVWSASTGQEQYRMPVTGAVQSVAFHANGKRLAVDETQTLAIYEAAARQEARSLGHQVRKGQQPALRRDGLRLATVGRHGTEIKVWNTETGWEMAQHRLQEGWLDQAAFDTNDSLLALTFQPHQQGKGSSAAVWDLTANKELFVVRDVAFTGVSADSTYPGAAFSPDGRYLALASVGGPIRIWETRTGKLVGTAAGHTYPHRHKQPDQPAPQRILFNGTGQRILVFPDWNAWGPGGPLRDLFVYEAPSGRLVLHLAEWGNLKQPLFSGDGRWLARGHRLWDLLQGESTRTVPTSRSIAALSHDGGLVAAHDGIWDVADGARRCDTLGEKDATFAVFTANNRRLLKVWDKVLETRDAITGELIWSLPFAHDLWDLRFIQGDQRLLVGVSDGAGGGTIKILDASPPAPAKKQGDR